MPKLTGFCMDFRGRETGGFLRAADAALPTGFCIGAKLMGAAFGAIAPPDVLVTNINRGSTMTGIEVAAAARALWPAISVILIGGLPANHTGQSLDPRP